MAPALHTDAHHPRRRPPRHGLGASLLAVACGSALGAASAAEPTEEPAAATVGASAVAAAAADTDPATSAGSEPVGEAEDTLVSWQVRIEAPEDIARLLSRYLDLARYQRLSRSEPITRGELQRLRQATPGQVRSLLETQGYFAPSVTVDVRPATTTGPAGLARLATALAERVFGPGDKAEESAPPTVRNEATARSGTASTTGSAADAPAPTAPVGAAEGDEGAAAGRTPPQAAAEFDVLIQVQPGARARVRGLRLEFEGPLEAASHQAGSGAVNRLDREAAALLDHVRARWTLPVGAPFSQDAWAEAKAAALATLRAEGYAHANASGSLARVDAPAQQVDLLMVIDSGPLYRVGPIRFEGLAHVDESAPRTLLTFEPGQPLREQPVLDFQDKLSKSGLFESIAIVIDPPPPPADLDDPASAALLEVPVLVRLRERPLHQLTVGGGYSDTTGPRVTLEHLNQSVFGLDWTAKTKLQIGRDASTASLDLTSHPQPGGYRNLAAAAIDDSIASGLKVQSQKLRAGRTRDGDRIERTYYLEYLRAATTPTSGGVRDANSSLAYTYQWVWRDLDSPILPTRGLAFSADTSAGHSFHTAADSDWFGRATGRLTGYWPLGEAWYGQARIQLGEVIARDGVSVPFTLLFRAGGDESVRGYAYQSLGPTDASGVAAGARKLATGSLEIARPLAASLPSVWGAAFVDAGNAVDDWNTFHAAVGWGFGIRWRSPVGPLRIDLAYGEQVRRARLHFSVGITF